MPHRVPGEMEPHERTIMCWPARDEIWGALRSEAEHDYATIARTIASFEPVTMVANARHAERAAELCGNGVDIVELPIDDSWARDSGPILAVDDGDLLALDWEFNAWGEKFHPFDADAQLVERWCDANGVARRPIDMVLEGGSITLDGAGTIVTTEQCLLHPNRNPSMSRVAIEAKLRAELAIEAIVWLPFGLELDDDTDGHVDNVAAFSAPGRVVVQGCDDPARADHHRLSINRRCLEEVVDARGRELEVVEVPVLPFTEVGGELVAVPYLNLYLCNGGVIVPVCGHAADDDMLALIGEQFPGRTVAPVPGAMLAFGGGGPHCITQQVPQVGAMT